MTPKQLSAKADKIAELYVSLQSNIISRIIAAIKSTKFGTVTQDNVLLYQAEQLNKMGMLTDQVIDLLAKTTGRSKAAITEMVEQDGMSVSDDIASECQQLTGKQVDISRDNQRLLNSLQRQTFKSIDNVINQSLVSRNIQDNAALRSFQKILTQSTMETLSGLKTHDRAISDSVYKLVNSGLPTNLVDKAGHQWSLEGYSRMVLQTTAHRTYNDTRMNGMDHYGVTLALMSSHPASREACAPIQGHVINQVPNSDPRYNPKYDSLYNHGYGTPAGTEGINCRHILYPFVEGVSTNTLPKPPDPDEAVENGKQQQRQRLLERTIRKDKQLIRAAEEMHDPVGKQHYQAMLANHRKALRDHIASHDFLHRDYSREKVITKLRADKRDALIQGIETKKTTLNQLHKEFGRHGFPQTVDEYRQTLYNKDGSKALHIYAKDRQAGTVEPVVTYKDYISAMNDLKQNVVGTKTADGKTITGFADHVVTRVFGAQHDASHGGVTRVGISTDEILTILSSGKATNSRGNTKKYVGERAGVVVNDKGKIVTVIPHGSKKKRGK
jgi:hypothetical protein